MDSIPKIYVAEAKFNIVFLILIRQLKQTGIGIELATPSKVDVNTSF